MPHTGRSSAGACVRRPPVIARAVRHGADVRWPRLDLSWLVADPAQVRLLRISTGLLVLVAATSCTSHACTEIGATSGVTFDFSALPATGAPWEVTACVREVCATSTVQSTDGRVSYVRDDALKNDTAVQARLRVVDASGETVVDDTVSVTPARYQPNGEGCEPIVWQVETVLGADGALQQVKPT